MNVEELYGKKMILHEYMHGIPTKYYLVQVQKPSMVYLEPYLD